MGRKPNRVIPIGGDRADRAFGAAEVDAQDRELVRHRPSQQLALAFGHVWRETSPAGACRALEVERNVRVDGLQTQGLHVLH